MLISTIVFIMSDIVITVISLISCHLHFLTFVKTLRFVQLKHLGSKWQTFETSFSRPFRSIHIMSHDS